MLAHKAEYEGIDIAEKLAKPYEKNPWSDYRKIFVKESRISAGAKFYIENKDLIKEVKIFDVYQGENIPHDKKSIAINVTIQSMEKTLKDQDLDQINKNIIQTVEYKTGAKIRS